MREPAGKLIDKTLAKEQLTWQGAQPFHVKLDITQTKGAPGDFKATIEEFWVDAGHWSRVVIGPGVTETVIRDAEGTHYSGTGEYFPLWLGDYVTALFNPVPDLDAWNASNPMIEYIVLPNGAESEHCAHHEFMLGTPAEQQINFANICFHKDGTISLVGSPRYSMEFGDYASFGKRHVARSLVNHRLHRTELVGKVTLLEPISNDPSQIAKPVPDAVTHDIFQMFEISTENLLRLADGVPSFQWPDPIPGHGQFTVWISLDKAGRVREAHPLNSDESGLAADMTAQLIGRQWKVPVSSGAPVQVQGPLVISYPPPAAR